MTATTPDADVAPLPSGRDRLALDRLLELRTALLEERSMAASPAVARALQMADYYLFLGLTYFGYTDRLFPEQD